jgi:hypothetical protein
MNGKQIPTLERFVSYCNTSTTYSSARMLCMLNPPETSCALVRLRSSPTGDYVSDLGIGKRLCKTGTTAACLGFCMSCQVVCSPVVSAAAEILRMCAESEQGVTLDRGFYGCFSIP